MKIEEYGEYLHRSGVTQDVVEKRKAIVVELISFLRSRSLARDTATIGKPAAEQFARKLVAEGRNTRENLSALRDYADWICHRGLYVALLEIMDCHNAMAVLSYKIKERYGREVYDRIFREALPPLGSDEKERCDHTRMITERMEQQLTLSQRRLVWFQVKHGIPADVWSKSDTENRQKYRQCTSIDEFLDLKRRERDTLLTRLLDEGRLWYTIEINDEVLEFIKSDPEMEGGRREGDRIYITKVPYNPIRYLHETDSRMKRYYACHCPLVREGILEDRPVSPDVYECSLGNAGHYLAGLNRKLEGEVLKSAVIGDTRCRFVFQLPSEGSSTGKPKPL
jgi:hypothetical protein